MDRDALTKSILGFLVESGSGVPGSVKSISPNSSTTIIPFDWESGDEISEGFEDAVRGFDGVKSISVERKVSVFDSHDYIVYHVVTDAEELSVRLNLSDAYIMIVSL